MDEGRIVMVPAGQVEAGPNHRTTFDPVKLAELAQSIEQHGLAQPITVRPKGGRFEIVAGERRFRACTQYLGWEQVPAIVRALDDEQANAIMLAENTGREDLNPMDEAMAFERTVQEYGWPVSRVAATAGVSASRVASRRKLLQLVPDIQALVRTGNLPVGLAEELSVLDSNRQRIALRWLNEQPSMPTRRVFAGVVGRLYAEQQQEALFDVASFSLQPQVAQALEEQGGQLRGVLPKRTALPALPNRAGSMGAVIDEYLVALLDSGHKVEAEVLMDFWAKLMESNYAVLTPLESQLLARHAEVLNAALR